MKGFVVVCFLVLKSVLAMSQDQDSIAALRQTTLVTLRNFRDELNNYGSNNLKDSLFDNVVNVIAITQTLANADQLTGLRNYFLLAEKFLKTAADSERMSIIEHINNDLSLKLSRTDTSISLNLEPTASFGTEHDVSVTAFIKGVKQVIGNYRIHWITFLGSNQEALIKANISEGNSQTFANPYLLKIKLPGYITFWMEDSNTQVLYKSDFIYSKMTTEDKTIQINFIPLKK